MQSKDIKIQLQEIPSMGRNVLEFFCVPLYTDYLSHLHKKFQAASIHDTNVES